MKTLDLLFCTNPRNPLSWLIRAGSWSQWSHVAIIDGDDVIEAIAINGVVRTPITVRKVQDTRWEVVAMPCADPSAVIAAAASQIGKPYDYTGVLGVGLHRDWQDDGRWFCSELVAYAFEAAGFPLFRADAFRRISPQAIWQLPPALSVADVAA